MAADAELFPILPSWLARMPKTMDALGVAASIERNVPRAGWRQAIDDAKAAGFPVDVDYLRDRWRIQQSHAQARQHDPETSWMAAESITCSGTRAAHVAVIVAAVCAHPGLTSAELAESTHLDRVEAARRTADAMRDGLINQGPKRKCRSCNSVCVTWWPTKREVRRVA